MLYLTSTVLILVLRTTLATTTALEHFVPWDNYALLPRMETPLAPEIVTGGVGVDKFRYIEVPPCANSFDPRMSARYTAKPDINLKTCIDTKSSVAWWPKVALDGVSKFTCVVLRQRDKKEGTLMEGISPLPSELAPGFCFTFNPLKGYQDAKPWQHPCEVHQFPALDSLLYSRWVDPMSYDECKSKPNAGAWLVNRPHRTAGCFVFFGPEPVWDKPGDDDLKNSGRCFVLDKVPVLQSYVEVHPCDTSFLLGRSKLFTLITGSPAPSTFAECNAHSAAVAWARLDPPYSECVPLPWKEGDTRRRLLGHFDRNNARQKRGLCFKFNADKSLNPHAGPDRAMVPYTHACGLGFKLVESRWYSPLPKLMTLEACGKENNVAAWKKGHGCFVFYWDSITKDVPTISKQAKGECFIRDRVVPLGSLHPPPQTVTTHAP